MTPGKWLPVTASEPQTLRYCGLIARSPKSGQWLTPYLGYRAYAGKWGGWDKKFPPSHYYLLPEGDPE